ncbi:MAG TPA: magnesium/cobalt transporter CorA [Micromonosporaceae bacterium]
MTRILGAANTGDVGSGDARSGRSVVGCAVYVRGKRLPGQWNPAEALATARRTPQAFVWLGLHEPAADEFGAIAGTFDLHELPVEDAIKSFQRPKLERYGAMTFAALRTTRYVEHAELTESSEVVETGYVMLFVGKEYVITVRHGSAGELAPVREQLEAKPELLAEGPWAVVHGIYDRIVDSYVDCAAAIEQDIDLLEESVFSRQGTGSIQRIYQLKRELVEFKRAVVPLQRPLHTLVSGQLPDVPTEIRRYFRDVQDHLTRTVEQVTSFDDLLNSILQAGLAQVTVDQNNDMRKIAAWAAIAAVWTAIAGIYGMNFEYMPELHWKYAYPSVLAVSVLASIALYRVFRKSGWL